MKLVWLAVCYVVLTGCAAMDSVARWNDPLLRKTPICGYDMGAPGARSWLAGKGFSLELAESMQSHYYEQAIVNAVVFGRSYGTEYAAFHGALEQLKAENTALEIAACLDDVGLNAQADAMRSRSGCWKYNDGYVRCGIPYHYGSNLTYWKLQKQCADYVRQRPFIGSWAFASVRDVLDEECSDVLRVQL